ncbi:type II toxin-antitoxin system Phd/YefM family antitoxin [Microlunatus elymi]|nr:prevent-host-death protein [Microlunatus elymi]
MTATEASRSFAALLDDAERGETTIVTRGGRRVATIGPAPSGNGRGVAELLSAGLVDDEFAGDVAAARESVELQDPQWLAG